MCCTPRNIHVGSPLGLKVQACCMPYSPMTFMWSKRKMIKALEKYLDELQDEIKDVQEQLAELKKEK